MDLEPAHHADKHFENSSLLSSFIIGGILAVATVATRKGAEHSWTAFYKKPPPHKRPEDADIKDAMVWAVLIGATTGLVRLGVRRMVRPKAKRLQS